MPSSPDSPDTPSSPDPEAVPPPRSSPPPPSPPPPPAAEPAPSGGPTHPEPEAEVEAPERRAAERSALASDLAEVERGRPERAFNTGAVVGVVLTVAAVIFVLQNNQSTTFDWLWFEFDLPLWTVLIGSLVVGALLVLLAQAVHRRRRRRIGRRTEAAGRLRRALGPGETETAPASRPRRWWPRRRRDPMRA